jgi:serine protease Do
MSYYNPRLVGGSLDAGTVAKVGVAVFVAVLLGLGCLGLALGAYLLSPGTVETIERATVWIIVGEGQRIEGSGVIITPDGYILTAAHVVEGARGGSVRVVLNSGLSSAETVDAQVTEKIGSPGKASPEEMGKDYALLKAESKRPLPYLQVIGSDGVKQGQRCRVSGYMLGSGTQTNKYGPNVTIEQGHITAIMRGGAQGAQAFNTDATLREGMSGGPCTDDQARVIGLSIMYSPTAGANLVLPTSRFKHVWEPLLKKGH